MGWYQRRVHGDCLVGLSMKSVILVAACLTAVLAVPNGLRLRPEEHWRPSVAKDLSKYRPRGEMFPIENSLDKTMTRRNLKRNSISASHYNLEEECGIEGPPSKTKIVGGDGGPLCGWSQLLRGDGWSSQCASNQRAEPHRDLVMQWIHPREMGQTHTEK